MNAIAEYQRHERRQALVPERVDANGLPPSLAPLTQNLSEGERLRLEACERVIRRGLDTFLEVGVALGEIRERKLYRQTYGTFEDYCRQKWEMTARRARQLMDATEVVKQLADVPAGNVSGATPETATGTVALPQTESQARPLVPLAPEYRRAAASRAAEIAGPGQQPTAKQFRAAAEEISPHPQSLITLEECEAVDREIERANQCAKTFRVSQAVLEEAGKANSCGVIAKGEPPFKIKEPFGFDGEIWCAVGSTYQHGRVLIAQAHALVASENYKGRKWEPGDRGYQGCPVRWAGKIYLLGSRAEFLPEKSDGEFWKDFDQRKPLADGSTTRARCRGILEVLGKVQELLKPGPPDVWGAARYFVECAQTELKRIAAELKRIAAREESPKVVGREKAQKSAKAESERESKTGGPFIVTKKLSGEIHYFTDYKGWNSIRGRGRKFADSAEAAAMAAKVGGKVVRLCLR